MARRSIMVRVARGSITKLKTLAVVVGHFKGMSPDSAEGALDEALGGAITSFMNSGTLKGDFGDFFAIPAIISYLPAEIAIVMGLGEWDLFCRLAATESNGRLPLLHQVAHRLVKGLLATNIVQFATVLMGAGGGGLKTRDATRELVVGICRALQTLDSDERIREFTIVEVNAKERAKEIGQGLEDAKEILSADFDVCTQWFDMHGNGEEPEKAGTPSLRGKPTVYLSIRSEIDRRNRMEFFYSLFADGPVQLLTAQEVDYETCGTYQEQLLSYAGSGFQPGTPDKLEGLKETAAAFYQLLVPRDVRRHLQDNGIDFREKDQFPHILSCDEHGFMVV
jgi:hypothetical protein